MADILKTPIPRDAHWWHHVAPGDFTDGYAVQSPLSPQEAAAIAFSMPGWATGLLRLRNVLMKPFGLKTEASDTGRNAIFPQTYSDADELILGTDDRHLDFRICLRRQDGRIHMGTWVHRNNLMGHVYLMVVMPFHVLIVRDAMRRIARAAA